MAPGSRLEDRPTGRLQPAPGDEPATCTHSARQCAPATESRSSASESLWRGDDLHDARQPVDEQCQRGDENRPDDQGHRLLQLDAGRDQLPEPAGAR